MLNVESKSKAEAEAYIGSGVWNNDTLYGLLEKRVAEHADKIAILGDGIEVSYGEWQRQAVNLAGQLQALGIKRGDVVAVQLPNSLEFMTSWLAISAVGAVIQTVHMPYRESELSFLLQHSGAKLFIGVSDTKGFSPTREGLRLMAELDSLTGVISVGDAVDGATPYAAAIEHAPAADLPTCDGDDLLCLLYTSGTTGNPKGVPIKNKWFMGNAYGAVVDWEMVPEDRLLVVGSFTHLYGLWTIILTLYTGGQQVVIPAFTPTDFVRMVEAYRPTGIFAVPAHVAALINLGLWSGIDMGSVRFMVQAGIIVPEHIAAAIEQKCVNGKVLQLFGMSELQCGAYTKFSDTEEVRVKTSGRPPNGMALKIVDDNGRECMTGHEGKLLFKGSAVFTGYLNNPKGTEEAFTDDGWFISGDTARLTPKGYLQITGRFKDIINRGGVKYHPKEVEDLVMQMPNVAAVAIIPFDDRDLGERACICVQPLGEERPTLDEINAALARAGIAKFKWPEQIVYVDEMPLTPTRKIIRSRLKGYLTDNDA